MVSGFDLAISRTAIAVIVVSVITLEGEAFAVAANFIAKLAGGTKSVLRPALSACIAAGTGETTVRARQTLFLLVIEEGRHIAAWLVRAKTGSTMNFNA